MGREEEVEVRGGEARERGGLSPPPEQNILAYYRRWLLLLQLAPITSIAPITRCGGVA